MNPKIRETIECDECGSTYLKAASGMANLCPNCAHYLYAYPECKHQFENGRCIICLWDGSLSKFLSK